jgi:hypothetical protein
VKEGIIWSVTTVIGATYYDGYYDCISHPRDWLLSTPDSSMTPYPNSNWGTMQDRAPALYNLVRDRSQLHGRWLPTRVPNGNYKATPRFVEPTCQLDKANFHFLMVL